MASRLISSHSFVIWATVILTVAVALFLPSFLPVYFIILVLLLFKNKNLSVKQKSAVIIFGLLALLSVYRCSLLYKDTASCTGDYILFTGDVIKENGKTLILTDEGGSDRLICVYKDMPSLDTGDCILGSGTVKSVDRKGKFYIGGGVKINLSDFTYKRISPYRHSLTVNLFKLRDSVAKKLLSLTKNRGKYISLGVMFSHKDGITQLQTEEFSYTGLSHLLSVSGLHTAIFLSAVMWLLRKLKFSKKAAFISTVAGGALLFCLSGLSAPVLRAVFMAAVLNLSCLYTDRRNISLLSLMAFTGCGLLVCPYLIFSLSFVLTVLITFGIVLFYPAVYKGLSDLIYKYRGKKCQFLIKLGAPFLLGLTAQISAIPVVAFVFGRIPLFSFVYTVITYPVIFCILLFGYLSLPFLYILPKISQVLFGISAMGGSLLSNMTEHFSRLPFPTVIYTDYLFDYILAVSITIIFGFIFISRSKKHLFLKYSLLIIPTIILLIVNLTSVNIFTQPKKGYTAAENKNYSVNILSEPYNKRYIPADFYKTKFYFTPSEKLPERYYENIIPLEAGESFIIDRDSYVKRTNKYCWEICFGNIKIMKIDENYDIITFTDLINTADTETVVFSDGTIISDKNRAVKFNGKNYLRMFGVD